MAKCCSTGVTSLPVWMSSGDDTEAILGASNLKRLSCHSFHLIPGFFKNTMANYRKRAINCLKTLKLLPFLNTCEQTLVANEYIRIRERLRFLYPSRDKEHDGV